MHTSYRFILVLLVLCLLAFWPQAISAAPSQGDPNWTSEQYATAAWDALTRGDYNSVFTLSDACVKAYGSAAARQQRILAGARKPQPPIGAATPEEANTIFANAVLNDVAACRYAKAQAHERLWQITQAHKVYRAIRSLTYARVFDSGAGTFWSPAQAAEERLSAPLYVPMVMAEWEAINRGDYPAALAISAECIKLYDAQARREQARVRAREPEPPVGAVTPDVAQKIFERALLNDVATCHFIAARASELSGDTARARQAYRRVLFFTYARVWDPAGGFFWSPAEAADKWLKG